MVPMLEGNSIDDNQQEERIIGDRESAQSTPIVVEDDNKVETSGAKRKRECTSKHDEPIVMEKKEHQAASSLVPPSLSPSGGLKVQIHEHSRYFDHLVELIPARFYLPVDDDNRPWFQGLSKAAKASAKKESRENIKKARRERLDPVKSSTTLDLLKRSIEADKEKSNEGKDCVSINRAVTYKELRQRLRAKIDALRGNRNTRPSDQSKPEKELGKRKRDDNAEDEEEEKKQKKDASFVDLSFGHVKIDDKDEQSRKRKGLSKKKALAKAEQLQEAKKDPEKGEIVSKKYSWKAAVSRAAGVKIHDDPKLIKESMKKEKKRREKNAEKWKERKETTEKLKAEKQKTRAENISQKIRQKKEKRIAKREKKLMRPGFEGRKVGYINDS